MKRAIITAALLLITTQALAIGRIADISVLDRQQNRTLPVYWHEGRAYVEGKPGNEYQVVVRNQAGLDVLAVVSVDGVNVVTGETAAPSQGGYVVDSWQSLDIGGWRKSLSRTAAFYFTELTDSYAARTGRPHNVGVIGAALYRRKPDVQAYIAPLERLHEGRSMKDHAERSDSAQAGAMPAPQAKTQAPMAPELNTQIGTGHGRRETSPARTVNFERATSVPEEVVSIYYDSHANLIARGIIPNNAWQRREPQPFPAGFVSDPPPRY